MCVAECTAAGSPVSGFHESAVGAVGEGNPFSSIFLFDAGEFQICIIEQGEDMIARAEKFGTQTEDPFFCFGKGVLAFFFQLIQRAFVKCQSGIHAELFKSFFIDLHQFWFKPGNIPADGGIFGFDSAVPGGCLTVGSIFIVFQMSVSIEFFDQTIQVIGSLQCFEQRFR